MKYICTSTGVLRISSTKASARKRRLPSLESLAATTRSPQASASKKARRESTSVVCRPSMKTGRLRWTKLKSIMRAPPSPAGAPASRLSLTSIGGGGRVEPLWRRVAAEPLVEHLRILVVTRAVAQLLHDGADVKPERKVSRLHEDGVVLDVAEQFRQRHQLAV